MKIQSYSRRSSILLGERRCTVFQRGLAKGIDLLLATAFYFIGAVFWKPIGTLFAVVFLAVQDSMGNGQSIGKRIVGLRVIDDDTGLSCPIWNAVLRNAPFLLLWVLAFVPVFWALALFIAVPVVILECYLIYMIDSGVRLGDVMGNTLVVEHREEDFENGT